jgi:hypothetical protein
LPLGSRVSYDTVNRNSFDCGLGGLPSSNSKLSIERGFDRIVEILGGKRRVMFKNTC